jgi:hypothetical protein
MKQAAVYHHILFDRFPGNPYGRQGPIEGIPIMANEEFNEQWSLIQEWHNIVMVLWNTVDMLYECLHPFRTVWEPRDVLHRGQIFAEAFSCISGRLLVLSTRKLIEQRQHERAWGASALSLYDF